MSNCNCIENVGKLLSEQGATLALVLTRQGSRPYIYANKGKKQITVLPSYCPFCGTKYEEENNK